MGNRALALALCLGCIFFGSCAENTMSNWISSYMEKSLMLDKAVGDIFGVAMFAVLLGLMRIGYGKFGKNIFRMLFIGMIGASVCYITVGLSNNITVGFICCVATGIFTSMLWPGTLIMMDENLPGVGVAAYALMAAGGDLGASVAPQLMGIVADKVSVLPAAEKLSLSMGVSAEQIGLKAGMLVTAIFPILGTVIVIVAARYFRKRGFV
jgi:fucose permease